MSRWIASCMLLLPLACPGVAGESRDPAIFTIGVPDGRAVGRRPSGTGLAAVGVFPGPDDSDYQTLLAAIRDTKGHLDEIKRFDMPGFRPREAWLREMKRYGILLADPPADAPVDPYAIEQAYWTSLWHKP